ncbi:MAG: hypothetical protein HHJ11_10945 [Phycicoccus sp.]|nr:hypothetical protein [Phycicoccus sp.]NMM33319.1 hypothetical protein [Phycicoccus sp.]
MNAEWPFELGADRFADLISVYLRLAEVEKQRRDPEAIESIAVLDDLSLHLARYLVVRSAGFVEWIRDSNAREYVGAHSRPEVATRAGHDLFKGQGVTSDQLKTFMGTFSSAWTAEIGECLAANFEKQGSLASEIGTLVKSRKSIAHGDGDVVSPSRALELCRASVAIATWIAEHFQARIASLEA